MKIRIILSALALVAATGFLGAAEKEKPAEQPEGAVVVRDTVYKNATQYSLDSLKYASEYALQTALEKMRMDRFLDSVVYSQMNNDQLYQIQMKKQDRYWTTDSQRFMNNVFPPLLIALCIMLAFWLVLQAREKGKRRAHELKMAQFEAVQKAKIVYRERRAEAIPDAPAGEAEEYEMDMPLIGTDYSQAFERTKKSVASYMRSPRKYRKTGVILLIIAVGTMVFFGAISNGDAWSIGIIPLFIGFAYLYLDYSSKKSEQQRRDMEEFMRYKAEKDGAPKQAEPQTGEEKDGQNAAE